MKNFLTQSEKEELSGLVSEIEKRTKTQIVLSLVNRSDSYDELPWKAFSLGSAAAVLILLIYYSLNPNWITQTDILITATVCLAAGILFALITIFIHPFGRLFLPKERAEEEIRQFADSLFLEKEMFAVKNRKSILIHISLFERKVYIHPDKGIADEISGMISEKIISSITKHLKRKDIFKTFENGLNELSAILKSDTGKGEYKNEIPDDIIEEEK